MNFFSKETIPDQTINKTEARIDVFRMEGAWSSVLRELEHFSDHFDQDIAVNTSQHTTSESVQAYYWVCMGEAALEIRSDVSNAMDCCLHALELDSGYSDGYIFMCRILLELSSQLLSSTNVGVKSRRRTRQYTSFVALDEDTAMADLFRTFSKPDKQILTKTIDSLSPSLRSALLMILRYLDRKFVVKMFDAIVRNTSVTIQRVSEPAQHKFIATQIVLTTCSFLLKDVDVAQASTLFVADKCSQYRLWLHADAVLTRGALFECLELFEDSVVDFQLVVTSLRPLMFSDENGSQMLALRTHTIVLHAACRVAVVSSLRGSQIDESMKAIGVCVALPPQIRSQFGASTAGLYQRWLPREIQASLYLFSALLYLSRWQAVSSGSSTTDSPSIAKDSNSPALEESGQKAEVGDHADLAVAYAILICSKESLIDMQTTTTADSAPLLEPEVGSLLTYVPVLASDPFYLRQHPSSTFVSIFQVKLMQSLHPELVSPEGIVKLLEEGCQEDPFVDEDAAWILAHAYLSVGNIGSALSMLDQSHNACRSRRLQLFANRPIDVEIGRSKFGPPLFSANNIRSLLHLFGESELPSEIALLPVRKIHEIYLTTTAYDPGAAIQRARQALEEFYSRISAVLLEGVGSVVSEEITSDLVLRSSDIQALKNRSIKPKCSIDISDPSLVSIVSMLGLAHSHLSRQAHVPDGIRFHHKLVALKCFDLILSSPESPSSTQSEEVVGGGSGTVPPAAPSPQSSREVVPSSVATMDRNVHDLCLEYVVNLAEIGERGIALSFVKSRISLSRTEIDSRMLHMMSLLLSESGEDPKYHALAIATCENALAVSAGSINVRLSLGLLQWSAGDREASLQTIISVAIRLEELMTKKDSLICGLSGFDPCVRTHLVDMSVICSKQFRQCRQHERALRCLQVSWNYLFDFEDYRVKAELMSGNFDEIRFVELMRSAPVLQGWRLPQSAGFHFKVNVDSQANILLELASVLQMQRDDDCHPDAIQVMEIALTLNPDHGPTLLSLAESHLDATYAHQDFLTERELYHSMIDSMHEKCIHDVAPVERSIMEQLNDSLLRPKLSVEEKMFRGLKARALCQQALRTGSLDGRAWASYGLALELLNAREESADACLSSLICQQFSSPCRPYRHVLFDSKLL